MFGNRRRNNASRGRRGGNWAGNSMFWMLTMQLLHQIQRLEHKPPVTLGLIAVNYAVYMLPSLPQSGIPTDIMSAARFILGVSHVDKLIPSSRDGGIIPKAVVQGGQWSRLFWGTIIHADAMHLYYNMSSLLFKGMQLEPALGSVGFGLLIAELWITCSVLYCAVVFGGYEFLGGFNNDVTMLYNTALVGFSGVLFGLKVVLMRSEHRWQRVTLPVLGIPISLPPKVVAWAELLSIKYFVPNSSFTGHLCGLLAGLIHVNITEKLLRSVLQRGTSGRQNVPDSSAGPSHGYTQQPNFNTGYPGAPDYYPQPGGYPSHSAYTSQSGYAQQTGYPQTGGYPPQAGYPPAAGYSQDMYSARGQQKVKQRRRWW